ncbi:MAG: IPT/TIG domain-containing protein [Nitrospira sp.]|nr:IPT/TIG domain-containing protein [Nitrospira sp.]
MSAAMTLFRLSGEGQDLFDGSVNGIAVVKRVNAKVLNGDGGVSIDRGFVDMARHKDLDGLQSFTIDAVITAKSVGGARQNIVEAQTPSVAMFIEANGKLMGSVHTAAGWVALDSGATLIKAGVPQRVTFTRDGAGKTELQIDARTVGGGTAPGVITNVGTSGFRVGMGMDGRTFPFAGTVTDLSIRQGVVTQQFFTSKQQEGQRLETLVKQAGVIKKIAVRLLPDESHARLQHVKDIMHAAGVKALSDLDTLPVRQATPLACGQVLVAPKKQPTVKVKWSDIAKQFRSGDLTTRREVLATHLTNQNSTAFLSKLPVQPTIHLRETPGPEDVETRDLSAPSDPVTSRASRLGLPIRITGTTVNTTTLLNFTNNKLTAITPGLLDKLKTKKPSDWPTTAIAIAQVMELRTIPIDSAVVIAGTLDLTEQRLVVEPNVSTLYIIAENVICGNNAAITWRRPGGSTPARADNPDLNGRDFPGVQTKHDSRDGLDGGDGMPGQSGTAGAAGRHAPNIEMWVKNMTGLPNLDFNGEDGIQGGRGQRGGRGGRGGGGHTGKRVWLFGWHCTSEGGDGGDGGNGARGGDGGRGGNGGNAGTISIGVLTGTLANTVVNKSFKIKNQGGRKGPGGSGGAGGSGGSGGQSGNGETCHDAKNGHPGAQGQPGAQGPAGFSDGSDAQVTFFEFSQAAWDDLMTRPWITQLSPTDVFPGDTLTIRGSRFTTNDRVMLGASALAPTVNADESISIAIPLTITGGEQQIFVRRADGTESNRLNLGIKPLLDVLTDPLAQGSTVNLTGRAFTTGATVLFNGGTIPATVTSITALSFVVPGTGGGGSAGGTVTIQVRNPDGRVSNSRTASQPRILEIPFKYGQHNLSFDNFTDGVPDWGTYEDTFGAAEVWHELLDPIFGHPVLTAAYFGFYTYFLKGKGNGGLATGFCTSLASLVADRFWLGKTDTPTVQKADVHKMLTGQHGKLLSRESLLTFHDQGREGIDRVEESYREIEATFLRGTDRQNMPLLFFIPSGEVWDSGYFDKLSSSHCVMPYRFVYPVGRPAPQLTSDGTSTNTDPDGVELFVWDCNNATSPNCKLRFRRQGGKIHFEFFSNSSTAQFSSQDGITLGMMRHGDYMLADHDLPFSGPFGLTSFIIDFLLSPADLQAVDAAGRRAGNFDGKLLSEIPGSHPGYLTKGMYLLPASTPLTRTIVGMGAGTYDYHSITPDGASILLQNVGTQPGHRDVVGISADATQIRFTPAVDKNFSLSVARIVNGQARALSIAGVGGGPSNDVDITLSPEMNVVRVGNRGLARNLTVTALAVTKGGQPTNKALAAIAVPPANDLAVTVTDWNAVDVQAQPVPFE